MRIPILGTTLVIRREEGSAKLAAVIDPPVENYFLDFVDILTANGQPFDRNKTYYSGQTATNYSMGFPPEVTNVDLTFGVTPMVYIEAMAQPTPR
jgi:hypothetical protein